MILFRYDSTEKAKNTGIPILNDVPSDFLREAKQFGLDGLYRPTEPERKMVQAQIDKVWELIGSTFDEFPFPVSGVYLFDDSVCYGDYEGNDGLCANQEKVNSNRKRAIIGIGKSAIEAGEEYTAFLLLHEITHAATATTGHNDRFHQYLNYLLSCFNQEYGTNLENDYSGD